MKRCKTCKKTLDEAEFYKNSSHLHCKICYLKGRRSSYHSKKNKKTIICPICKSNETKKKLRYCKMCRCLKRRLNYEKNKETALRRCKRYRDRHGIDINRKNAEYKKRTKITISTKRFFQLANMGVIKDD